MLEHSSSLSHLTGHVDKEALESLLAGGDAAAIEKSGYEFFEAGNLAAAAHCFDHVIGLGKANANTIFVYSQLINDGTHRAKSRARDLLLSLIEQHPVILELRQNEAFIRIAAMLCHHVGPIETSVRLTEALVKLTNSADDYFDLSERLAMAGHVERSVEALEAAIRINPGKYSTEQNLETVHTARAPAGKAKSRVRKTIGRYPEQKDFLGDFDTLVKKFIARDLAKAEKFLNKSTKFFTMGSCFARNVSRVLAAQGYVSNHLEMVEHINTTFANRIFVEWMTGGRRDGSDALAKRFSELVPAGWSPEITLSKIKEANVFILTLGVAPAFFDQATGEYILPRSTELNTRVLSEQYVFRTTSVQENVDNVRHLIDFIRGISPGIKIVVTVSPVPLMASFEFESCVQADCLSKSTMRLVAHEIVNKSGLKDIYYWPSFEIFRWAGSNSSSYFGADDGSSVHASEDKVSGTIKAFIDIFSAE